MPSHSTSRILLLCLLRRAFISWVDKFTGNSAIKIREDEMSLDSAPMARVFLSFLLRSQRYLCLDMISTRRERLAISNANFLSLGRDSNLQDRCLGQLLIRVDFHFGSPLFLNVCSGLINV